MRQTDPVADIHLTSVIDGNRPAEKPVVKPRKKARKRQVRSKPVVAKAEAVTEDYPGLTVTECAKACNADGCVISGKSFCGHPRKGSQCDMSDPAAVGRLHRAQKQLALSDAEKRFS